MTFPLPQDLTEARDALADGSSNDEEITGLSNMVDDAYARGLANGLKMARCECEGLGLYVGAEYGYATIPDGWTSVQRCDMCNVFDGDASAARAHASTVGTCMKWVDGPVDHEDSGDRLPGEYVVKDSLS